MVSPFERVLSRSLTSRQHYRRSDISPATGSTGIRPPASATRSSPVAASPTTTTDYRLPVGGWLSIPCHCRWPTCAHRGQSQITRCNCIQGWTAIAEWGGVPLAHVVELVRPRAAARHVVFYAFDDKGVTEGEGRYGYFYGSIPLYLATSPQTILALEVNGAPLPVELGAPVRVRIETQLGFKMVKWVKGIEFVADFGEVGMGQGGWREDQQYYANAAGI